MAKSRPMELNPAWKGGRIITSQGYACIKMRGHHRANKNGYVREHILVAERVLGKQLPCGAVVHHVNEDRADNRPENLVILQNKGDHQELHKRLRALKETGDAKKRVCAYCGEYDEQINLSISVGRTQFRYWHKKCNNDYQNKRRRALKAV